MDIREILLDPRVLVTFIICAFLGILGVWLALALSRRQHEKTLTDQRRQQEEAVSRILDSFAEDKDEIVADYETRLKEQEGHIALLEKENARLKERLAQGGFLGMFGGRQRDVISALLLENEQLHEILAQKQEQLRELLADLTGKLLDRLDEQVAESTRAIRYKQVLLSAFLQQEEARSLLDRLIAEGRLSPAETKLPTERLQLNALSESQATEPEGSE